MSKIDADAFLNELLGKLGSGVSLQDAGKVVKKVVKKEMTLTQEAVKTYRIHKPSMETVSLVLMVTLHHCQCCDNVSQAENKHLFAKKKDRHGNLHYTRYLQSEDVFDAPREIEYRDVRVAACVECFLGGGGVVVLTEEAYASILPASEVVVSDVIRLDVVESEEAPKEVWGGMCDFMSFPDTAGVAILDEDEDETPQEGLCINEEVDDYDG